MKMPSIRQSTSAHELFHKLQYAYGYKTRWVSRKPILWFTEGTAAWAEVFVWGRVSRSFKIEDMFKDTSIKLYEAEDMALPFWIYFVSGNSGAAKDQLMVNLFEKCEQEKGDVEKALFDVIREAYGSVDSFFLRFELERKNDFWQGSPSQSSNYTRIQGPDGRDLVTEIKQYQHRKHWFSVQ
jgi:AAA+ ATPase superfamily predicted ATPase